MESNSNPGSIENLKVEPTTPSKSSTSQPQTERSREHHQRTESNYDRKIQREERRRRNHWVNPNYNPAQNIDRRPHKRWPSSGNKSGNRVWQRPNSGHSSDRYTSSHHQNYSNTQSEGGSGEYYRNRKPRAPRAPREPRKPRQPRELRNSRQPIDFFSNFQPSYQDLLQVVSTSLLEGLVNQNIPENCHPGLGDFSNQNQDNDFEGFENQSFPEGVEHSNQNQELVFDSLENQNIPGGSEPGTLEPSNQDEKQAFEGLETSNLPDQCDTEQKESSNQVEEDVFNSSAEKNEFLQQLEALTKQNQDLTFGQFEQINQNCEPEPLETNPVKLELIDNSQNDLLDTFENLLPEPEFNLDNCSNSNNRSPSISVIPISRLIKSEIQDLNRTDIIAPTTPNTERRSLKPNLIQRKKSITKDGSLSENLVQRVANMDKVGIKNVINSSGTKYDAALKIQARKRLREEIRKQLKSMNFTPPEDNENNVLIPDEIVDSMNIPAVVLDEIRKAFGIVLVEDKNSNSKLCDSPTTPAKPPETTDTATQPAEAPPKSPDLMSRLKMLEVCKSQSERVTQIKIEKEKCKDKEKEKEKDKPRRSKSTEPILIIDSSSSSSSCSSSSSDSDSSSTSSGSNCSNTSSFKRRRRKKRILEANVVGNFEKLILPNLTTAQRRRYKDKYSKTTKSSLLYIYGVCVSRANHNKNSTDQKEQLKIKKNLSSADNAQALEFLMKAILNLFERQKETLRKNKEKKNSIAKPQMKSSYPVSSTANKLKDTTCNQRSSDDDIVEVAKGKSESANSGELSKHQSTNKLDKASTGTEGSVNKKNDDSIGRSASRSANSAQRVSSDDGAPVASDLESDTEAKEVENAPSRLWKSPGEKKCIEIESLSPLSSLGTLQSPLQVESASSLNSLGMMQPPLGNYSFDIDSLKSQSSIGDEAVTSIREIDVKLMELHKRKMYIEEMILKLQKDKMEVDLWTMKLQNEKFIILNSALASTSSSSVSTPKPAAEKRKAVSENPCSRKKRCQREILLEDADNAINSRSMVKENISDISFKSRQTRRSANSSKSEESSEGTSKVSKDQSLKSSKGKKHPEESTKPKKELSVKKLAETFQKNDDEEEDDEENKTVEVPQVDYSNVPNGNLEGWKLPITQIIIVGDAIIAASEDGNIYKFNIRTRVLESKFSKHTEAITQIFTCPKENFVYTTSLDGFLRKTSIENFGLELLFLNLQEPLQSIDIEWSTAFIGSRWGNIFTYDIKNNSLSESLLCSSGSSIIAIKATKEGPRKILIVSSKGNQINFRDAMTGLLLRSLDVPDNLHIYSILLDDSCVYCGTQRNEIHQYNFTTGGRMAIFQCGNGAVSMKLYKDKYIFVGCYDGFVYVLDKTTGCQIGRFPGSGKMILALEIAGDKLITSAKDNTMQMIDIPKYIATIKDKS